jgi:hypothetical protein
MGPCLLSVDTERPLLALAACTVMDAPFTVPCTHVAVFLQERWKRNHGRSHQVWQRFTPLGMVTLGHWAMSPQC